MKTLIPFLVVILFVSCDSDTSRNTPRLVTPEEQKMLQTLSSERTKPESYLTNLSTYRKGILGNMNITIRLRNDATYTTYQDVEVEIIYFSKTNTKLGTPVYDTLYEQLSKGKTGRKELKLKCPKDAEKVSIRVISATVVSQK